MSELLARSLPGFRFVSEPPPLREFLPRMDIAVLVGFASRGPVDLPVAIEDAGEFAAIFGPDAPLAWDTERGEVINAYLGPAVRAFFRNGGTRCWVVRVTGAASTNVFPIPGLLRVIGSAFTPALAPAASPGSWSDALRVGSTVSAQPLEVVGSRSTEGGGVELDVNVTPGTPLVLGDVLRLHTANHVGFLPFESVADGPVASPPADRVARTLAGRPFWFRKAAPGATPASLIATVFTGSREPDGVRDVFGVPAQVVSWIADDRTATVQLDLRMDVADAPDPGALVSAGFGEEELWVTVHDTGVKVDSEERDADIVTVRGGALWRLAPGSTPSEPVLACDRVRLDLWVRETDVRTLRLGDLGLAPPHPRYWANLRDDNGRYAFDEHRDQASAGAFSSERAFPLAGGSPDAIYLPLDVSQDPDRLLGAARQPRSPLERDGLSVFGAALFVDLDLVSSLTDSLMDAADHLRYSRAVSRRPRGLHVALDIEEATLLAVPDGCHRGWTRAQVDPPSPPKPSATIPRPEWWHPTACEAPSPEPLPVAPPFGQFLDCTVRLVPRPGNLRRLDAGESGTYTLAWNTSEPAQSVLDEARADDFSDAVAIYAGSETRLTVYGRSDGTFYYRVRAVVGGQTSDWSDGLAVRVTKAQGWTVNPPERYSDETLVTVQRALLRAAAARGDLFAVLALPAHYREDSALSHADGLKRSPARYIIRPIDPAGAVPAGTRLPVSLPIGAGEARALSFGAVYHPWLFVREPEQPASIVMQPPDGTLAGLLASRARLRGAWIAAANEPLAGVAALSPPIARSRRSELMMAQINVITQEPRGFVTLSADTLSSDADLVSIGVRRLLSLLRRLALREGATYVFEPHDVPFQRLVQRGFEGFLARMFERGAFAGRTAASSYQVVTSTSLNTPESRDQGRFIVELRVAPALPLTFLTVRLVQSGDRTLLVEER